MTSVPLKTRGVRLEGGSFSGKLFTRVPVGYLHWMVVNGTGQSEYAEAGVENDNATDGKGETRAQGCAAKITIGEAVFAG